MYSNACKAVNKIASTTVKIKPRTASVFFPAVIAWCEYVTVAPEQSNNNVFKRGTSIGLKTSIPFGGQTDPISITGAKAAAKNAQKKAKKNIISETMNNNIP